MPEFDACMVEASNMRKRARKPAKPTNSGWWHFWVGQIWEYLHMISPWSSHGQQALWKLNLTISFASSGQTQCFMWETHYYSELLSSHACLIFIWLLGDHLTWHCQYSTISSNIHILMLFDPNFPLPSFQSLTNFFLCPVLPIPDEGNTQKCLLFTSRVKILRHLALMALHCNNMCHTLRNNRKGREQNCFKETSIFALS